jgi:hypothetical protein
VIETSVRVAIYRSMDLICLFWLLRLASAVSALLSNLSKAEFCDDNCVPISLAAPLTPTIGEFVAWKQSTRSKIY